MLDVVANHVGIASPAQIVPFNSSSHYHDCGQCPFDCNIRDFTCFTRELQWCRLAGLPDLNQTVPFVKNSLLNWIRDTISTFRFDGIRIDTVPEVPTSFWVDFVKAAGVYAVGEVFSDLGCCVAHQQQALPGVLSYPLFWTMRDVFMDHNSMYGLQSINQQYLQFPDVNLLGTFIDNHDQPRFMHRNPDYKSYENAIAYTLMSQGIPIIYYGTEQGYRGGPDPANREVLWPNYGRNVLTDFIQLVVNYRKKAKVWNFPQVQRYADDQFYAFTRGNSFVATTNVGGSGVTIQRTISYHPYPDGTTLCNLFFPSDCVKVQNGIFIVVLVAGECKIFHPGQPPQDSLAQPHVSE